MKIALQILALSLLLVLNISVAVSDTLKQGWQTAKNVGAKIIDPVNIPKYNRLLKEAQAELNACVGDRCNAEKELYTSASKDRNNYRPAGRAGMSPTRGLFDLRNKYNDCMKQACPTQYSKVQERQKSVDKRELGVILGVSIGTPLVTVGVVGGTAVGVAVYLEGMDRREFKRKYGVTDEQARELEEINNRIKREPDVMRGFIPQRLKEYIETNPANANDGFVRALRDMTPRAVPAMTEVQRPQMQRIQD